ncbi:MAG: SpoIIE family protein phosphatase [Acidobacteria bacterium]|jgi:serine phosphatase RsbU (regulator of sigma subunit)|nr:SpoIIE family protein phosphatase [Acidobacteriota bacterium]
MLKHWEKIDILLVILIVITSISYFFFDKSTFRFFFWVLIITASLRLLYVIKKKLFWKVRNRLVFSGLFLIATPLFFLTIFFYIILNIIIVQYGMVIMSNLLKEEMSQLENAVSFYLVQPDLKTFYSNDKWKKVSNTYNIAFFEANEKKIKTGVAPAALGQSGGNDISGKGGIKFENKFKYPQNFDVSGLFLEEYSGFFLLNNQLYYGCLKKNELRAILFCITINQQFLDKFASISDFRMKYQGPDMDQDEVVLEVTSDAEVNDRQSAFNFPWVYKYTFKDFSKIVNSKAVTRSNYFWFFLNFDKIFHKISVVGSDNMQTDFKKAIFFLIVLFGAFIVGSFVIGLRSVLVITRSLHLISRGTKRIRSGDFSFRIKTRSGDELQDLGESFNEMAAGIERLLLEEKEKQRLEEELRIARGIQLKLLPPDSFVCDEFEIAAVNIPAAEIAGDYFDYFYKKEDYFSMLVADVSGKGAKAAFYMAELKGVINHLQKTELSPAALVTECHNGLNSSFDRVTFITIALARFILAKQKFQLVRAGHTPAIFYKAQEKKCYRLYPDGVAVGLMNFSREKIKEIEVDYHKDDILFLFSDGLSEIMNEKEELLGFDNLEKIITNYCNLPVEEIKQKLLDFSVQFSQIEIASDDLTFILLKVKK